MIEKLYYMPNYQYTDVPIRDFYLFGINPELGNTDYSDNIIFSANDGSLISLYIERQSNHLVSFSFLACPNATFYDCNFNQNQFLSYESAIAISTKNKLPQYFRINFQTQLELYKNAAIAIIAQKAEDEPLSLIHVKNMYGVLIKNDLSIYAFVILNILPQELAELKKYRLYNIPSKQYKEHKIDLKKLIPMQNKKYFILKIIELKNIDIWHLLYYCYQRQIIDDEFLVDYAIEMLEQGSSDPLIVELAGLLDTETSKAEELLESKIAEQDKEKILYADSPFYNKLLFYLIFAAKMCEKNIIE